MLVNRYRIYIACMMAILLGSSCERSSEWDLAQNVDPALVVEAIMTDEFRVQELRLSLSNSELNETSLTVQDASVRLLVNQFIYEFDHVPDKPGLYASVAAFAILPDLQYELQIDWGDQQYKAKSSLSVVAPIEEIYFASAQDSLRMLGEFVPSFLANQQAMYQVDIDWTHLSNSSDSKARQYLYVFNDLHLGQLIPARQDTVSFPVGSQVIVRKYGLNDDFAHYLRAINIETNWSGSFFYSQPNPLVSNFSPHALGFFSTCAVKVDTITAQ